MVTRHRILAGLSRWAPQHKCIFLHGVISKTIYIDFLLILEWAICFELFLQLMEMQESVILYFKMQLTIPTFYIPY